MIKQASLNFSVRLDRQGSSLAVYQLKSNIIKLDLYNL